MQERTRYLYEPICQDAIPKRKIVMISGPRQVGKTTLAKQFLKDKDNYFSYDNDDFRKKWAKSPSSALIDRSEGAVVLDEIHKDRLWKRKIKGLYDQNPSVGPYIVTGSARLDLYRKGSDSLLGRYLPYRLHPLTIGERILPPSPDEIFNNKSALCSVDDLLNLGGFPEPFFGSKNQEALRWSRLRLDRLVQEDTRDILAVADISAFRLLPDLLPERVGSPLSLNALREDVGKAYATVRSWYQVLEALYYCITIRPYSKKINRAIRSEPKMYLFDILQIPEDHTGKRLENLTALHLYKACQYWTDTAQGIFDLHFVRDKSKREVDFLITSQGKPWMLVECKSGAKTVSPHLRYYAQILNPKYRIQLVKEPRYDRFLADQSVRIMGYDSFFSYLP